MSYKEYKAAITVGKEQQYAIIISRFNSLITEQLIAGAKDIFVREGGKESQLTIVYVPGSMELPIAAKKLAISGKYSAVVCLGAVIRGQTPHFDYVASESAKGIAHVALESGIPVIYGVITADTLEQAIDRAGVKAGNKGADAMMTAIEMANLFKMIEE